MSKFRGTKIVKLGERELTLSFSINSVVNIEESEDLAIGQYLERIAKFNQTRHLDVRIARKLIWYALRDHHSDITIDEVGDMLSRDDNGANHAFADLCESSINSLLLSLGLKSDDEVVPTSGKAKPRAKK